MYAIDWNGWDTYTQGSWDLLRGDEGTSQRLPGGGGVSERFDVSFFLCVCIVHCFAGVCSMLSSALTAVLFVVLLLGIWR